MVNIHVIRYIFKPHNFNDFYIEKKETLELKFKRQKIRLFFFLFRAEKKKIFRANFKNYNNLKKKKGRDGWMDKHGVNKK